MSEKKFTVDDLTRILAAGAGTDETVDLGGDILDSDFEELGYESLALLETCGLIEREFGITLDDDTVTEHRTPRAMVDAVNAKLAAAA
ncbi:acyl carrier protein [Saccharothrix algeriensis]|uniref:Acyl carrier protein n=1 Tax=Saccharothrix algeriensis TaxID=173560 RepID=A0A8T8HWS1_9PSEU|nr:acyl carrier protein [Saccharothrix algeriensis]MBM7814521.1 act minimal PKS acyl carrier protein [Saccharothrix algeriensis]QTR02819.1 acyl carrier protein [Saccharothrix algeriensis]